jgi:DNA polymerase III sliding clamp (beta) subunit (PCNA family)
MQFTTTVKELKPVVDLAKRIAASASKNADSIFHRTRLHISSSLLQITATNLEITARLYVPIRGEYSAETAWIDNGYTVNIDNIHAFLAQLPKDVVFVVFSTEQEGDRQLLVVSAQINPKNSRRIKLPIIESVGVSEFPAGPIEYEPADRIAYGKDELERALTYVLPSAAKEDNRPILTGVLFEDTGLSNRTRLATADGYRLHTAKLNKQYESLEATGRSIIIPAKALKFVMDGFSLTADGEIRLERLTERRDIVQFHVGVHIFSIMLIDGRFPAIDSIIDGIQKQIYSFVDRSRFAKELKFLNPYTDGANSLVLRVKEDTVVLSAPGQDQHVETEMPVDSITNWRGIYNIAYLLEMANVMPGNTLLLNVNNIYTNANHKFSVRGFGGEWGDVPEELEGQSFSPMLIRGFGPGIEQDDFLCVVMPMSQKDINTNNFRERSELEKETEVEQELIGEAAAD